MELPYFQRSGEKSGARKWGFNLEGTLSVVFHKKTMLYYVIVFLCIHFYSDQKYQAFNIISSIIITIILHCLSYNKANFNVMSKTVDIRSLSIHSNCIRLESSGI